MRTVRSGRGIRAGALVASAIVLGSVGWLAGAPAYAFSKKKALGLFYTKTECDARFAKPGDAYTKAESDARYPAAGGVYTKADVYTKAEADGLFAAPGDAYTKAESDARYPTSIWATVGANGSLIRGNNTTAGTTKTGTGQYEVHFNQDVFGCAKAVTFYGTIGMAAVLDGSDATRVVVSTANSSGAPTDLAFHLVVFC